MGVGAAVADALPSGRTTYRRLPDYGTELNQLAANNPGLVKSITLPFTTYEGRTVEGIEIATNPNSRDGKPVFLLLGLQHGRDWPSGEHAMEFAFELVNGFNTGDARIEELVRTTRTIVVPVVNPDSFNVSREFGEANGGGGGRGGNEATNVASRPIEYRRKNCRLANDSQAGNCAQLTSGVAEPGVDPDRNHGLFWSGPGADANAQQRLYRGPGPWSEPESSNIRDLLSSRHVATLISNSAFGNRVMRAPGTRREGEVPDEGIFNQLELEMADHNGYLTGPRNAFYDASGTLEDWSYYSTGALAFAFEIGCENLDLADQTCNAGNFHPPYATVAAGYDGTGTGDGARGNGEAFLTALESTADSTRHAVLEGGAPPGSVLRLTKSFETPTWPLANGLPILLDDALETTMQVPGDGNYEWHVNPSTRPLVAQSIGRVANGDPSSPDAFAGDVTGSGDGAAACGDTGTAATTCFNDHPFTVPSGAGIDNARARIRIEWADHVDDWDLKVFRDSNGDGSSVGETELARSAQRFTQSEETEVVEPEVEPGQEYVARVTNFAADDAYDGSIAYEGPDPVQVAQTESWTLTCELPEGTVRSQQTITIGRGESQSPDLSACFPPPLVLQPPAPTITPPAVPAKRCKKVRKPKKGKRGAAPAKKKKCKRKKRKK